MTDNLRPDPDAAFFEDWSEWRDLGGGWCYRYPPARRNDPLYHCTLMTRVPEMGNKPGFVLRVHGDSRIRDMLKRAGAFQRHHKPDYGYGYQYEARCWYYVPVARWRELRAILPEIRRITIESGEKYYGRPKQSNNVARP